MNTFERGCKAGLWLLGVAVVWMSFAPEAYAGPFRVIGYDAATMMTANSNVSYGESMGVLYTNPALMSRFPNTAFVGVTFWKPDMNISLMPKPAGTDVPLTIFASKMGTLTDERDLAQPTVFLKNKRRDTSSTDPYAYLSFGSTLSFGIKGFRFGTLMTAPIDSLRIIDMNTYYATEYEQFFSNQVHFTNFGEWNKAIDSLLGLSYSPIKYVSIGISLRIGMSTATKADIYMPDATKQDYSLLNNKTSVELALKPIVGIQVEPTDWMAIGVTWRYRSYMNVDGGGTAESYQLTETSGEYTVLRRANQKFDLAMDYEPQELTGSVGFKTHGFTTNVSVTWNMWKFYLDSHHQNPEEAAMWAYSPYHFMEDAFSRDPFVDAEGNLTAAGEKLRNKFKWRDTPSVSWGGQYKYLDRTDLSGEVCAGFAYIPTPVPAQVGRTNYADNDVYGVTFGHRLDFTLFEQKFGVDVALQYWQMLKRTVYKDPSLIPDEFYDGSTTKIGDLPMSEAGGLQSNNPGYPGYSYSGYVVAASLSLRYKF
ncbi:MAG: hypothetical protein C4523_16805 [Myxococcales bacterium]|nr:MAG: hypothetical protein C4523_16805 [Myxococcales bacterium]